jgi:hypothetical protein
MSRSLSFHKAGIAILPISDAYTPSAAILRAFHAVFMSWRRPGGRVGIRIGPTAPTAPTAAAWHGHTSIGQGMRHERFGTQQV